MDSDEWRVIPYFNMYEMNNDMEVRNRTTKKPIKKALKGGCVVVNLRITGQKNPVARSIAKLHRQIFSEDYDPVAAKAFRANKGETRKKLITTGVKVDKDEEVLTGLESMFEEKFGKSMDEWLEGIKL